MTAYGRLYEQVSDIRRKLLDFVPERQEPKGPRMNTLEDAIGEVAQHTAKLQELLRSWAALERQMTKEPG